MDRNMDRNKEGSDFRNQGRNDYRAHENFGNSRRNSDRDQAQYYGREEGRSDDRNDWRREGGNDQHQWDRNFDGGRRDVQRDDRRRHSFGSDDAYEDGPHYHGSFDTPNSPDRQRDRGSDFRPLNGSFTNTVDRGNNDYQSRVDSSRSRRHEDHGWSGFREVDRDANRELSARTGRDFPRTSSLYGSRANDMSRGMNPYGYGLGDSNYNDSYYGRSEERSRDFSPDNHRWAEGDNRWHRDQPHPRRENHEGMWEQMKDSVKSFFGKGPKGWKRSDERIREDVCEVLARHPGIDASEIEVDVKDGYVSLRGEVDSRFTKRRAEDVIEHISGVHDVRNELSVKRPDVEGGMAKHVGSGTGTSLGSTSPLNNQSGASLIGQSRPGGDTAFGSTGTAGTMGSAVNSGTSEGDGTAKRERSNKNINIQ